MFGGRNMQSLREMEWHEVKKGETLRPFITVEMFPSIQYSSFCFLFNIENFEMMKRIFLAEGSSILFQKHNCRFIFLAKVTLCYLATCIYLFLPFHTYFMLAKKIGVLRLGYVNYPPVYYSRGDRRPSVLGLAWSVLVESAPPTYYSNASIPSLSRQIDEIYRYQR